MGRIKRVGGTPWGSIQGQEIVAPGIVSVWTAGHGGLYLSEERTRDLEAGNPEAFGACIGAGIAAPGGGSWWEEDCASAYVIRAFPDAFPKVSQIDVDRMIASMERRSLSRNEVREEGVAYGVKSEASSSPFGGALDDAGDFRDSIESAFSFAATDSTRLSISAVFLESVAGTEIVNLVATDGHRIQVERFSSQVLSRLLPEGGAVLRRSDLKKFRRVFRGGKRCGRVLATKDKESGNVLLLQTSGKTSGECVEILARHDFPNWRPIADASPSRAGTLVVGLDGVEMRTMVVALRTLATVHYACKWEIVAGGEKGVRFRFSHERLKDGVAVSAIAEIDVAGKIEQECTIGINPSYLADLLGAMGDMCTLSVSLGDDTQMDPIHVHSLNGKFHRLVMPLRLS